jgi:dihydropteroate synthase
LLEKPRYINAGGKLIDLETPKVMAILNITTDSFYKGSRYNSDKDILNAAAGMLEEGADILDVGGYSSRPGATDISAEEESKRVLNGIRLISRELPQAIISVDTFRAAIAREAITECGAHIINDISGGEADKEMFPLVQKLNVPYIIMHMKGNPRTMQDNPVYDDVVADILRWFGERIFRLQTAGVKDIILDPGFGFGKTTEQNFEILTRLSDFSVAGLPLMVGLSRKGMIWKTLGITPDDALNGTTVLNTVALTNGADILRVHDVKEAVQTVRLVSKIKTSGVSLPASG